MTSLMVSLTKVAKRTSWFLFLAAVLTSFWGRAEQVQVLRDPEIPGPDLRLTSASYSPSGDRILTSSEYGLVRIWDAKIHASISTCKPGMWLPPELQRKGRLKQNLPWIRDAEFSPDGSQVVMVGPYGHGWIWKQVEKDCGIENLTPLQGKLPHTEDARTGQFSHDGQRIATTSDDSAVKVWDVTGKLLASFNYELGDLYTTSAVFSPDDQTIIASRTDGLILKIDAQTFESTELKKASENPTAILEIAMGPRQDSFVTAASDGEVAIWDFAGNKLTTVRSRSDLGANSVAVSPDRRWVAVGTAAVEEASLHSKAQLYRVQDGKLLAEIQISKSSVSKVNFSPDGKQVLVASYDGTATIWNIEELKAR
ncbi:MAG: hypothetical protein C5B49_08390 [Bdellovibrio sp.]|nr:MAG: hypothetical protein C5B49_08390 [Bdellovibrio sp.]